MSLRKDTFKLQRPSLFPRSRSDWLQPRRKNKTGTSWAPRYTVYRDANRLTNAARRVNAKNRSSRVRNVKASYAVVKIPSAASRTNRYNPSLPWESWISKYALSIDVWPATVGKLRAPHPSQPPWSAIVL